MSVSLFPMTIKSANMNVSRQGELKRFWIIFCISWIPPSCLWPCLWRRLRNLTLSDSSTLARATFSVSFIPSSSSRQVKHWLDVLGIFSRLRFLYFVCLCRLCLRVIASSEGGWLAQRDGRKGLNIKWCFLTFTQFSLDVEAKNNMIKENKGKLQIHSIKLFCFSNSQFFIHVKSYCLLAVNAEKETFCR